ncbi:hypothetical protein Dimus_027004 [Dionaea muscipula]
MMEYFPRSSTHGGRAQQQQQAENQDDAELSFFLPKAEHRKPCMEAELPSSSRMAELPSSSRMAELPSASLLDKLKEAMHEEMTDPFYFYPRRARAGLAWRYVDFGNSSRCRAQGKGQACHAPRRTQAKGRANHLVELLHLPP